MNEWTTYRLTDLIPFSHETLHGLAETYNQEIWPVQLLFLAVSAGIAVLLFRSGPRASRFVCVLLAGVWLWTGLVYQRSYFETINWPAKYYAWLFVIEAGWFAAVGGWKGRLVLATKPRATQALAVTLFLYAAFAHLPVALFLGDLPSQVLLFGWGPDLTALGTVGIVLMFRRGVARTVSLLPPVLWLALSVVMKWVAR